jgi:hypothetical protein
MIHKIDHILELMALWARAKLCCPQALLQEPVARRPVILRGHGLITSYTGYGGVAYGD